MQLLLPIFPRECKMISSVLGVYEHDAIVQYVVNGLPVFSHGIDALQDFLYITSNFISQGICTRTEVERCFFVSTDSISRGLKKFNKEGASAFFSGEKRHGHSHKLHGNVLEGIQKKLDTMQSVNSIAKESKLTEGAIRYAINKGYLKKISTK